MSRLVIFTESPVTEGSAFVELLKGAHINPQRQTFASAESTEELREIMSDEKAEFALLAGEQPFKLARPDLSTQYACGRPFYWGDEEYGMLATINPDALQRNKVWSDSVQMHLDTLVRWAKKPEDMLAIAPKSCTICARFPAPHLDGDLLPFCDKHK